MNLEETIADLEKQAAQYTQAANTLRSLTEQGSGQTAARKQTAVASKTAGKAAVKRKRRGGSKAAVSPETRARISAALKASHAARKAKSDSPAPSASPAS